MADKDLPPVTPVTGSGAPIRTVVEASLGTATGDMHASTYGLDTGDMSADQFAAMRRNGMSWSEIGRQATEAKRAHRA